MTENNKQHVKVTGAATHRTGTLRAAVKPQKRANEPDVKQIITTYMGTVKAGSLAQTFWGPTVAKNAAVLCKNFGLATSDEPYLLLDASNGGGKAGMLLSKTGIHFSDGRGSVSNIAWAELPKQTVAYQRGMLVVGKSGIVATDGKALLPLLQQLQAKLSN